MRNTKIKLMEKITDFLITNEHGELISIDKLIELYEIYQNKSKLETFILIPKMLLTNNINNVFPIINIIDGDITCYNVDNDPQSMYRKCYAETVYSTDAFIKPCKIDSIAQNTLLNLTEFLQRNSEIKNKIISNIK